MEPSQKLGLGHCFFHQPWFLPISYRLVLCRNKMLNYMIPMILPLWFVGVLDPEELFGSLKIDENEIEVEVNHNHTLPSKTDARPSFAWDNAFFTDPGLIFLLQSSLPYLISQLFHTIPLFLSYITIKPYNLALTLYIQG